MWTAVLWVKLISNVGKNLEDKESTTRQTTIHKIRYAFL
jgi:hypothetical protein